MIAAMRVEGWAKDDREEDEDTEGIARLANTPLPENGQRPLRPNRPEEGKGAGRLLQAQGPRGPHTVHQLFADFNEFEAGSGGLSMCSRRLPVHPLCTTLRADGRCSLREILRSARKKATLRMTPRLDCRDLLAEHGDLQLVFAGTPAAPGCADHRQHGQ